VDPVFRANRVIDKFKGCPQDGARSVDGVREVDNFYADLAEGLLQPLPFGSTAPIVTFEENREPEFFPNLELVREDLCIDLVDIGDVPYDLQPLR